MKEALAAAESELTGDLARFQYFIFLEQGLSRQKRFIPLIPAAAAAASAAYTAIAGITVTSAQVTAGATVVGAGATTYVAYKTGQLSLPDFSRRHLQ